LADRILQEVLEIDLEKSELIAILEKRTQEEIKKVLMRWGT
jgi:transposase